MSIAIAYFYYFKSNLQLENRKFFGLSILRFISSFLICTLLLSPIIKCNQSKVVKPKVVFLIDNSQSIKTCKIDPTIILSKIEELKHDYESKGYEVELKAFGENVSSMDSFLLNSSKTNIFNSIETILNGNLQSNLQEIILVTDGNYNQGNNPIFINTSYNLKIQTILLGDTSRISDSKIINIDYNPIVLQNENNHIDIQISSTKSLGTNLKLKLEELIGNEIKLLSEKTIKVLSDPFYETIQFSLNHSVKGKHLYRASLVSSVNEINVHNNQREFWVDVIDDTKNIEILSNFPHPDISAIKTSLEKNKSYKVVCKLNDNHQSFDIKSDVIVLYQIPNSIQNSKPLIDKINIAQKSILYIIGSQSNYTSFNLLQSSFKVQLKSDVTQDYLPYVNSTFNKFYLNENTVSNFNNFPPLSNKLLDLIPINESSNLISAKIGSVQTHSPLVSFANQGGQMIGLIGAENIWKWKISNYNQTKTFDCFDDLMSKTMNALAIKKDKKQILTVISDNVLIEGDKLSIHTSLFNDLYQPISSDQVKCILSSSNYRKEYDMIRNDQTYHLDVNDLKPGLYSYSVSALLNGKKLSDNGQFIVNIDNVEMNYLPSNFEDMESLAIKSSGKLYLWNQVSELKKDINQSNVKDKIVNETTRMKANDIIWILIFILGSLSIEWLLRKYYGLQ